MKNNLTVKLLLANGNVNGLLIGKIHGWDGLLLSSPKSHVADLLKEEEAKHFGVFILLRDDKTFIMQEKEFLANSGNLDKYDHFILLTTEGNTLEEADVIYVKYTLLNLLSGEYLYEKEQATGNLDRFKRMEMDIFIERAFVLLGVSGIDIFHNQPNNTLPSATVVNLPSDKLETDYKFPAESNEKDPPRENTMTKKEAVALLKEEIDENIHITFGNANERSCARMTFKAIYLAEDIYLVLNDTSKRQVHLFLLPAKTMKAYKEGFGGLYSSKRKDGKQLIVLNIQVTNFRDSFSQISFKNYLLKTVSY